MKSRNLIHQVKQALAEQAAVGLLGPRQVGKTTLALAMQEQQPADYIDLQDPQQRQKLDNPRRYFSAHTDRLIILDEIHHMPEIFPILRGEIDRRRRAGNRVGQFLILGSAALSLLRQSSESLAGRITYLELGGFNCVEIDGDAISQQELWLRGGFPDSFLASSTAQSLRWRKNFIRTYIEREIPLFGPRIGGEIMTQFWGMLAHLHGGLWHASDMARNLGISTTSVNRYLDLLVDLFLLRRLRPYHVNHGKRLIKSPKIYWRDSGILHSLLDIALLDQLLIHPQLGNSYEGWVIENIVQILGDAAAPFFYRTAVGAEIDLVLQWPNGDLWAIEIKNSTVPKLARGFHQAVIDIKPVRKFVVYLGEESFYLPNDIQVISLRDFCALLQAQKTPL